MLPMGTIMTCSMLAAVLFAVNIKGYNPLQKLPKAIIFVVASITMLSGLWNVFWYAAQHLGERWGNAALLSGLLLIITSLYLFNDEIPNAIIAKIKPLVLLGLFSFAMLYGYTIYHL